MAISLPYTANDGEVPSGANFMANFNTLVNNGIDLWSPATKAIDMNGFEIILDADADSSITADTDDQIDFKSGGTDILSLLEFGRYRFTPAAQSGTPGVSTGAYLNIAAATFTDNATAGSGTATSFAAHAIARPTLAASNSSVTTTDATVWYLAGPVAAGTNQTLTNAWSLWLASPAAGTANAMRLDGHLVLVPFGTSAGNTGEVRYRELAANGTNYIAFKAPDSIASNVTFTLPSADGAANTYLGTNGSGTLSFTALPTFDRVQVTGADFSTTSTSFVDVTSASLTITTKARPARVGVVGTWINSTAGSINYVDVDVDGTKQSGVANGLLDYRENTGNYRSNMSFVQQTAALSAGSHTFKIQMRVNANTGTIISSGGDSFFMWVGEA